MDEPRSCPNCGSIALPGDKRCWQCGYDLVPDGGSDRVVEPAHAQESEERPVVRRASLREDGVDGDDEVAPPVPRSLAYMLLTTLLVVVLLLVLGALRRYPIIQMETGEWAGNWRPVDDPMLRYTISLPPDWTWHHVDEEPGLNGPGRDAIAGREAEVVIRWVGHTTQDVSLLAWAESQEESASTEGLFLLIAQLPALNEAEVASLVSGLIEEADVVEAVDRVENFARSYLFFETRHTAEPSTIQCRSQLYARERASYLVLGCGDESSYRRHEAIMLRLLNSFQPFSVNGQGMGS